MAELRAGLIGLGMMGRNHARVLASLEGGEVNSIPFDLNGRVTTVEDGVLRFEYRGHLYPVPGRPGQFRSAVTQARELQREDDF